MDIVRNRGSKGMDGCPLTLTVPVDMCDLRSDERMASGKVIIHCMNLSNKTCYILE
jgi:hypothetical protein